MQERLFDGHTVEHRQARVSGGFDLTDAEAERLGLDRMGIVVMAVYVGGANVKILPNGDVRRVDMLSVSEAKVLTGTEYDQAREWLMEDSDQLDLFHKERSRPAAAVDEETGEIASTVVDDVVVDDDVFTPDVRPSVRSSRDETLARFLEEAR